MNTGTTQKMSDVREKILATGQRIIAGKGFSGVGINEILATVGVPKGSFYHYFGSKIKVISETDFLKFLAQSDAQDTPASDAEQMSLL